MSSIKFRMAAKTDMGMVRTNNEDNFQAAADLTAARMSWVNNEIYSLGHMGALLVVADGMGGMNAGEVASELAVETIREFFSPQRLSPDITRNRFSIEKYMNAAIVAADTRIKQEARMRPETRGMGTTIVIGWVIDGKLYISWCGDSRAYIYNPQAGLHQVTKDHSYVQSLVDKGTLTREEAFDFPDSNIITQSLSDAITKAKPESLIRPYDLCNGDIVMLCTDGLSGMLRDADMEAVIRANEHDMDKLTDELIHAACEAEGSDNITVSLLQVLQGGGVCDPSVYDESERWLNGGRSRGLIGSIISGSSNDDDDKERSQRRKQFLIAIAAAIVIIAMALIFLLRSCGSEEPTPTIELQMEATTSETHPAGEVATPSEEAAGQHPKNEETVKGKASSQGDSPGANGIDVAGALGDALPGGKSSERLNEVGGEDAATTGGDTNAQADVDVKVEPGNPPKSDDKLDAQGEGPSTPSGGGNTVVIIWQGDDEDSQWHVVKKGENLYRIAKHYGILNENGQPWPERLAEVNNIDIENIESICEGDSLRVPKQVH